MGIVLRFCRSIIIQEFSVVFLTWFKVIPESLCEMVVVHHVVVVLGITDKDSGSLPPF